MIKTKDKFIKEIWDAVKSMPLEKREAFLNKIEDNWLVSIKEKLNKELKKYWFCKECEKYFPLKDIKVENKIQVLKNVLIQSDCGYGDDDILGDVEYLIDYCICPKCGRRENIKYTELRTLKEYRRRR